VGRRLAEEGCSVVTGFARGIDESATFGALEAGGRVVAVLPYLFERDGGLSLRALRLLRAAAEYGASASVVAENLVKDDSRVRIWLTMRNKIIVRLTAALVVPEARFKARWGTRRAVEHALATGRPVLVFKPSVKSSSDVAKAYDYFRWRGVVVAEDVDDVIDTVERQCRYRSVRTV
jgi:predicted Rossmann fold nucleotide-binding protein DprA/Smf involved in DNA uptake